MGVSAQLRSCLSFSAALGAAACLWMMSSSWEALSRVETFEGIPLEIKPKPSLVVIDAGHGGQDGGTQGFGALEKNLTLDIALKVEKELLEEGLRVLLTRHNDTYISLEERSAISNLANADAFVSIHLNADPNSADTSGIETYFSSRKRLTHTAKIREKLSLPKELGIKDGRGELLAMELQRHVSEKTGLRDRGPRDSNYMVVAQTECPAVLIECGFLTNADESKKMQNEAFREKMAQSIAEGVTAFVNATRANPRHGITLVNTEQEPAPVEPALINP